MKEEVSEKCDLCGEYGLCVYLRDWGGWICLSCYSLNFNYRMVEKKEVG